ncbi:MAG: alpha/beta fold hydrolase [Patescibacteria group bacterium]|nr:alpha/beta fold hydrolase [Patescibacteria group bacterium]
MKLNGVWLGTAKPETLYIFIHGLGGSVFSRSPLTTRLASGREAVLAFNNRGSGTINYLKQGRGKSKKYFPAGVAHEVFSECLDDIDGAVAYARAQGVKRIFLLGHSTGCQKSIYYLAKRPKTAVRGAVLLAPISDYADVLKPEMKQKYGRALAIAKRLKARGRFHDLLPASVWPAPLDAQRFLSLYTLESAEEIFTYASGKEPRTLLAVKKPILSLLAEDDEFADRPALEIKMWFDKKLAAGNKRNQSAVIKGVSHGFEGGEKEAAALIRLWAKSVK